MRQPHASETLFWPDPADALVVTARKAAVAGEPSILGRCAQRCRRRAVALGSGSEDEGGDEGLQLFPGRLDFGGSLLGRGRQVGDRGFGVAELVERLLVKCRIASNRREIVAQPFFVLDELVTLLFQLIELSVLPPERLPSRSELSKRLLDRGFELV